MKDQKAIALCRVSTFGQDLKQQEEKVLDAIKNMGYLEENIIVIKDAERVKIIREEIYSIVVLDKPFNSTTAKVAVSFNAIVPELEDSRIEIYNINTKNYEITNEKGQKLTYNFLKRFSRTEKVKESMKKACKKYQDKKGEK